ncbi:MAG: hypothetical protein AB1424_11525 [Thermodesulfobacteriota bacterium]
MKKRNNPFLILVISFVGSYLTAFVFVVALNKSLPPTDLAYGQTFSQTFSDPFIRDTFNGVAFISGIITFVAAYFCLRERNLRVAVPIVFGSVLLWVAAVTPYAGVGAWPSSYVVLFGSLLFCKLVKNLKPLELEGKINHASNGHGDDERG